MKLLDIRLSAINKSQQRSRTAFFVMTAAAAVTFLLIWNLSFSWGKNIPGLWNPNPNHPLAEWQQKEIFKEEIKPWVQRYTYSTPSLGISMRTDDMGLVAPFAILILTMYYASCQSSIRYQINDLEGESLDDTEKQTAYLLIRSEMILNNLDGLVSKSSSSTTRHVKVWAATTLSVYRGLVFAPAIAAIGALIQDGYSAYIEKQYFLNDGTLSQETIFRQMSPADRVTQAAFDLFGFCMTLIIVKFTVEAARDAYIIRKMAASLQPKV